MAPTADVSEGSVACGMSLSLIESLVSSSEVVGMDVVGEVDGTAELIVLMVTSLGESEGRVDGQLDIEAVSGILVGDVENKLGGTTVGV